LLVGALQLEVHELFKEKFKNRDIQKKYVAIIEGSLPSESGLIQAPLARSKKNRSKRTVDKAGRDSITKYEVIEYSKKFNTTKVELELVTGRNHQIRAHMEHMKTPILNDVLYGASQNNFIPQDSIALHSRMLKFTIYNEQHSFIEEPPLFFNQALDV
tara:strand:- start:1535 stop:2008 length:474 start_codon:yes stop_codon:yes gene_type:complete